MAGKRKGAVAGALVIGLLAAGGTSVPMVAQAADTQSPAAAAVDPLTGELAAQDAGSAAAAASASGRRVEVLADRTEYVQEFANPDGSRTHVMSAAPVRVHVDGRWAAIDTSLEQKADGRLGPRATLVDLSFSPGGDTKLMEVGADGTSLAIDWHRALPAPQVSGSVATYLEVFPGVDLEVQAHADSVSQVLVVKDAAAAENPELRELSLGAEVEGGGVLEGAADGGLVVVDAAGERVLSSPAPLMWDSSGERADGAARTGASDDDHAPGEGDQVVAMPTEVSSDAITLNPDEALLSGAATTFPVYIDPIVSAGQQIRAMVNRTYPTTSYVNWSATSEGMGYNNTSGTHLKRLFWQYDTVWLAGKQVLGAKFGAYETYSYSCTASQVNLHHVGTFGGGTTWNAQPWVGGAITSATVAHGRTGCNPYGAWVEFNITGHMAIAARERWGSSAFGLLAANEGSNFGWKRFRSDAYLSVDYNTVPDAPVNRYTTTPAKVGCFTSPDPNHAGRPWISNNRPTMWATGHDGDGHNLEGWFEIWRWGGSQLGDVSTGWRASGST